METKKTVRGFDLATFTDLYGEKCRLQKSSLATKDAVWLGIDDLKVKILASRLAPELTGWVDLPLPEQVHIVGRMHLDRDMAGTLAQALQHFADTGEIK